jgi:glycosyltransferase involved in cell wall biosynthesis
LNSLLAQDYSNLEILLIDDGSTDQSGFICDQYAEKDKRIKVVHKANGGLADARNVGLDHATGGYITCIDSDDFISPDYISYLYNLAINNNCEMSICNYCDFYEETGKQVKQGKGATDRLYSPSEAIEAILYQNEITTSAWGKLYRTELYRNVRYPKGMLYEDLATVYLQMDKCNQIFYGHEVKYFYRKRTDSIMNRDFSIKKMDMLVIAQSIVTYIGKNHPELKLAAYRRYSYTNITLLRQMVFCERRDKSRERAIRRNILAYMSPVLHDSKTVLKDKIAICCAALGIPFFKFCWRIYAECKR